MVPEAPVYDFWFPAGLDDADVEMHRRMFDRWFVGKASPEMQPFAYLIEAFGTGRLDHWLATPLGRLSLILVLDQFPRALFAGTSEAYVFDSDALRIAEEGIRNSHYEALARPWEKTFFFLPLAHAEGPDHCERLGRVVAMAERVALDAPERLKPLYRHSVGQARGHLDVITRFGRFPHRNPILGRPSTPAEQAYLEKGGFVHTRRPPQSG
jgi:uncharacterized protein (DUF924 family)